MTKTLMPDELLHMQGKPVWFESKTGKPYSGWVLVFELHKDSLIPGIRIGATQPSGHVMWLLLRTCGVSWRCWDTEPTDKERTTLPWSNTYYQYKEGD